MLHIDKRAVRIPPPRKGERCRESRIRRKCEVGDPILREMGEGPAAEGSGDEHMEVQQGKTAHGIRLFMEEESHALRQER